MLADVLARRIRIVVVYKVDRLTRSLADFTKIVEQFDAYGVSFVSVSGANWQGMSTYVSHGRKCFWFSLAEDGFQVGPFEPEDDDDHELAAVAIDEKHGFQCDDTSRSTNSFNSLSSHN